MMYVRPTEAMEWTRISAGHYEAEGRDHVYNVDKMNGHWRAVRTPKADPQGDCEDLMGYETAWAARHACEMEEVRNG